MSSGKYKLAALALIAGVPLLSAASESAPRFWALARPYLFFFAPPPPGHDPVDAVAWGQVVAARQAAGLDNDALAVLGLEPAGAEAVLAAIRTWFESNRTTLEQRRAALADAGALVRHYRSEVDQGQDAAAALTAAESAAAARAAEFESLLDGLRTAATASLSAAQRDQLTTLRSQRELKLPYRALALDAAQRRDLGVALSTYHQRISAARRIEDQSAARTQFEQDLAAAIGAAHQSTLAALSAALPAGAASVVQAENTVFPRSVEPGEPR